MGVEWWRNLRVNMDTRQQVMITVDELELKVGNLSVWLSKNQLLPLLEERDGGYWCGTPRGGVLVTRSQGTKDWQWRSKWGGR